MVALKAPRLLGPWSCCAVPAALGRSPVHRDVELGMPSGFRTLLYLVKRRCKTQLKKTFEMFGKSKCFKFSYCTTATASTVSSHGVAGRKAEDRRLRPCQGRCGSDAAPMGPGACAEVWGPARGWGCVVGTPSSCCPQLHSARGRAAPRVLPPAAQGGGHIPVDAGIPSAWWASWALLRSISSHSHSLLFSVCLFICNLSI